MIEETNDPLHLGGDSATLLSSMHDLRAELSAFRPLLERANRTARRAKVAAAIGILVGVVGVVIGIGGWIAQVNANQSTDAARQAGCIQQNVQALEVSSKLVNGLKAFFDDPDNLTPQEQAALNVYEAATQPEFRDCSEAGIKAYIENPPVDPALDP